MPGFKEGFVWGAATASYQIEGGGNEGGRGDSIWDMFARKPGAVFEGHNGSQACDHYHRFPEDVALMKQLGLDAYRLSIAWPRIQPSGTGSANKAGLDFYDRLIDELLKAGIDPWVTLYHWDLPTALYHRGGWLNREMVGWFADYTEIIAKRLGDRVRHWMTLNEPQVFIGMGMFSAEHAPGDKLAWREILTAIHHSHLVHFRAMDVLRAHCAKTPSIGAAPVGGIAVPNTESEADIQAAKVATFAVRERANWQNAWYWEAMIRGEYPADGIAAYGDDFNPEWQDEIRTEHRAADFFGVNIYSSPKVKAGPDGQPVPAPFAAGNPRTAFHWPVVPEVLYWATKFFYDRYGLPIYITENGMANVDWVMQDGRVHDAPRIDFLSQYLQNLRRAHEEGVDIGGYFQWSLLDNFEWAEGYKMRFGLVHVDYETFVRTPKDSFYWYRDVINQNGAELAPRFEGLK